ncbi:MFS transporter [Acinetobacter sp. MD2]|nr:MFS transporter [Acinetobacter sp. MD2]
MMKIRGLRWWMISLVTLGLVTNYLARNTLSVSAADMMTSLNVSTQEYAYIVTAWQLCYAFMQPIAGWIVDFLGTKAGFAIFAFAWSIVCMLPSLATSWQGFAFFRGLLGITEAAGLPAGVKTATEWFPAKERSVAIGWMNVGASFGAMLAPPIVVWAMFHGGWQFAFVVVGVIGIIWSILWVIFYKHPQKHQALTAEEHQYIVDGQEQRFQETEESTDAPKQNTWKNIFKNRNIYSILAARFLTEPAWQTFNAWIPLYLMTQRGMNIKEVAMFAWLPFLAADLGCVLGGYLSPFVIKHFNVSMETSRKVVMVFGSLCMIGPACVSLVASPYAAIALLCVGGFAHQTLSGALYSITSDSFGKKEVATATGIGGMSGYLGAAGFTLLFGLLVTQIGYGPLFALLAGFDIFAAILVWFSVKSFAELKVAK